MVVLHVMDNREISNKGLEKSESKCVSRSAEISNDIMMPRRKCGYKQFIFKLVIVFQNIQNYLTVILDCTVFQRLHV